MMDLSLKSVLLLSFSGPLGRIELVSDYGLLLKILLHLLVLNLLILLPQIIAVVVVLRLPHRLLIQ